MLMHGTTDGFRANIGALHFLDGKEVMNFHNLWCKDQDLRLLLKHLRRNMPQCNIREQSEALDIYV